jgi:hypothetical protein
LNLEEYISSGIIESYVLNQISDEERKELEAMATKHPEIKAEIRAVEEVLVAYAMAHSKVPPLDLKQQIFSKIQQTSSSEKREAN